MKAILIVIVFILIFILVGVTVVMVISGLIGGPCDEGGYLSHFAGCSATILDLVSSIV